MLGIAEEDSHDDNELQLHEESDDDDEIPEDLASAILRNPPRTSSSRSSSRSSSNYPNGMSPSSGGFSALQQLPAPIPPLKRSYSTSSASSPTAGGTLVNLIFQQPTLTNSKEMPVVDENEKTPNAEPITGHIQDAMSDDATPPAHA